MKQKLTNQQIENAFLALSNWQIPSVVSYQARLRLIRNHRKLTTAFNDKEQDRIHLAHTHVKDGSKAPPPGGQTILTPDEHVKFQPEYRKLMLEEHEIEIHPLELFSSREQQTPLDKDHAVDISTLQDEGFDMQTNIISALLDVVFFEPGHKLIKQALTESGKNGEIKV